MRVLLVLLLSAAVSAQTLSQTDRARLAEAFRLGDAIGPGLWAGWDAAPFAVLLVADDSEFLIRGAPTPDFTLVDAFDPLLGSPVYARDRVFPPGLLATFPAVGGVPTVVVGTAEATGQSSTDWALTVVHEHVHQLQMGSPGYVDALAGLDLDGGDTTGRWMLDYPFPYADPAVAQAFATYAGALADALDQSGPSLEPVQDARARLRATLSERDDLYLAFQMWQEGVARYAEIRAAETARGTPVAAYAALADAVPYGVAADTLRARLMRDLRTADLGASGRVALYAAGAAQALLLDGTSPGWRERSLADRFDLDRLIGAER